MILYGYMVESQDAIVIEEYVTEIHERVRKRAAQSYKELLQHEIEVLVDAVTLNQVPSPNCPILDAAENILINRIRFASMSQLPTPYNFNVSLHLFYYDKKTFIRLNTENNIYSPSLKDVHGLIPCHVTDNEAMKDNSEIWQKIMQKYSGATLPAGVQLLDWGRQEIDYKKMRFKSPAVRAKYLAEYNIENRLLNMLGNNEQIPGYRLMEFFAEAVEMMAKNPVIKSELASSKRQLCSTLINITHALITKNPNDSAIENEPQSDANTNPVSQSGFDEEECESECDD